MPPPLSQEKFKWVGEPKTLKLSPDPYQSLFRLTPSLALINSYLFLLHQLIYLGRDFLETYQVHISLFCKGKILLDLTSSNNKTDSGISSFDTPFYSFILPNNPPSMVCLPISGHHLSLMGGKSIQQLLSGFKQILTNLRLNLKAQTGIQTVMEEFLAQGLIVPCAYQAYHPSPAA